MALPASGTIRLQQIQAEFGRSGLAASAVAGIPSTALVGSDLQPDRSMRDFLGRSNISYAWGGYPREIPETGSGIFNVITTGVPDGNYLYWSIENITTNDLDFDEYDIGERTFNITTGFFRIDGNTGNFTIQLLRYFNYDTNSVETFRIKVYETTGNGGIPGTLVLTSETISIIPVNLVFYLPGTYTVIPPSSSYRYADVAVSGAGGGGAGHFKTSRSSDKHAGGGGGGGGVVRYFFDTTTVSGNITVNVGTGGAAGPCYYDGYYNGSGTVPRTTRNGGDNGTQSWIFFYKTTGGTKLAVGGGGQGARGNNVDNNDQASGAGGNASGGYNYPGLPGNVPDRNRDYYSRTEGGLNGVNAYSGYAGLSYIASYGAGGASQNTSFLSNSDYDLPFRGMHGVVYIKLSTVPSGLEDVGGPGLVDTIYNGGTGA